MLLKKFDTRSVLYIRHGDLLILAVWSEILKLYAVQSQLRFLEQFLCFFEHMLTAVPPAGNLEDALNCLLFIKITLSWNPEQRKKTLLHGYSPPSHITAAFQKWALVTKDKVASHLDHDPKIPHYWSEHPRGKVFGANTNAFSSRFSGFFICHPIYDENMMLLATRHAIYSAAVGTEETATFMLPPS